MTRDELAAAAGRLLADYDALRPWRTFVPHDGLAPEQAYAIHNEVARLREDRGEPIIGYKVGCTSRSIQEQLGIREPIFGRLFDSGCFPAGGRLPLARFANLAVEGELAVRLAHDLPHGALSDGEYLEAIASVFPVIELHHHALPAHALAGLIASGGMHAGFVLADYETACAGALPVVEELNVTIDDRRAGLTHEPWTMGGPAATLRWLSARLGDSGRSLRRGQIILTGSALPLYTVGPGSRVAAAAPPLGQSIVMID